MWRYNEKPGTQKRVLTQLCHHPDLGLLNSRTIINKAMVFLSYLSRLRHTAFLILAIFNRIYLSDDQRNTRLSLPCDCPLAAKINLRGWTVAWTQMRGQRMKSGMFECWQGNKIIALFVCENWAKWISAAAWENAFAILKKGMDSCSEKYWFLPFVSEDATIFGHIIVKAKRLREAKCFVTFQGQYVVAAARCCLELTPSLTQKSPCMSDCSVAHSLLSFPEDFQGLDTSASHNRLHFSSAGGTPHTEALVTWRFLW